MSTVNEEGVNDRRFVHQIIRLLPGLMWEYIERSGVDRQRQEIREYNAATFRGNMPESADKWASRLDHVRFAAYLHAVSRSFARGVLDLLFEWEPELYTYDFGIVYVAAPNALRYDTHGENYLFYGDRGFPADRLPQLYEKIVESERKIMAEIFSGGDALDLYRELF